MNRKPLFVSLVATFIALLLFCGDILAEEAAAKKSIVLLPLQTSGNRDISYLQTGIRSMLASRLAAEAGVNIVDQALVDKEAAAAGKTNDPVGAAKIAASLQADFALACTLTAIGNSMSLDAKLYPANSQGQTETFYASAASEDEIIGAVDSLAWDIAEKTFGKQRPVPKFTQQAQMQPTAPMGQQPMMAPALPTGQPQGENPAYMTAHPDRQFMGSHGGMSPAPIMFPTAINSPFGFTKSQNLNFSMQALDVGDIDGDGQLDVAIAEKNKVTVYHLVNNRLVPFGEIETLSRYKIISIDLADINGNGKAELYVTGVDWITPDALGAEWQGKEFSYLFKNERWYVRPVNVPGPGLVLAGQRPAMDAAFAPGIYQVRVTDSILQQEEKLPVPDSVNLYDFSMADLDGDGKIEIIALDESDKLLVLQSGGKQLWKSDESFGGNLRYVGGENPRAQSSKDIHETREKDRTYIHARIVIDDINNDNQPDIIINKNLSTASKVLKNLKNYPSGEIHALAWNGIGLTELWRTRKIDGYVSSYQFVHDKEKESPATLFVGIVLNSGWTDVFSAKDSTVLIYPLDLAKMQQQMESVPQGYQYMGQ